MIARSACVCLKVSDLFHCQIKVSSKSLHILLYENVKELIKFVNSERFMRGKSWQIDDSYNCNLYWLQVQKTGS